MNLTLPACLSITLLTLILSLSLSSSHASENSPVVAPSKRLKAIDFEDDLVEGLNKRPLDSLQSLKDQQKRRKGSSLYRKRMSFKTEVLESVRFQAEGSQQ